MIKHFAWQCNGFGSGRVAVRITDSSEEIEIAQLFGNAPPANPYFLAALVTNDEYAACEAAHLRRVNPWAIEARVGTSGAADLRLRVLENEALQDAPVRSVLHISMNDKLNRGYRGWIGDFWCLLEHWPTAWDKNIDFSLEPAEIFTPAGGWNQPATAEGYSMPEALAALIAEDAA